MIAVLAIWLCPCIQASAWLFEACGFFDRQLVGFAEAHEPVSGFISDP